MIAAIHKSVAAKREDIKNNEQGFTLIELLVVVLIIGILAAIAIPVFLGQQDQAKDSAAKSDLANAKVSLIAYSVDNNGDWTTDATELADYGYVQSENTESLTITTDAAGFCIEAEASTTHIFSITDSSGVSEEGAGCDAPVVP